MSYAVGLTETCRGRSSLKLITKAAQELNMDISSNSSKASENLVRLGKILMKMCANRTTEDGKNQTDVALLTAGGIHLSKLAERNSEREEMDAFFPTAILCIICVMCLYMLAMLILMCWYMRKGAPPSLPALNAGEFLAGPLFWLWFYFCGSVEEIGDVESEDSSASPDSDYEPWILRRGKTVQCEFPATTEKEVGVPPLRYTIITELDEMLETETTATTQERRTDATIQLPASNATVKTTPTTTTKKPMALLSSPLLLSLSEQSNYISMHNQSGGGGGGSKWGKHARITNNLVTMV